MLSNQEAAQLIKHVLVEKNVSKRIKKAEKIIGQGQEIPDDPSLHLEVLVKQYLEDCVTLSRYKEASHFLDKWNFTANEQKKLLDTAVDIYLSANNTARALEWIKNISYIFGTKAIAHLAKNPKFLVLKKSTVFQKFAGSEAKLNFFKSEFKEITRMWNKEEYDNIKDAIFDAKSLYKDAKKIGKTYVAATKKHLDKVLKQTKKMIKDEPDLKKYVKGLI